MNKRVSDLVNKTSDLVPGVYTLTYEDGTKGIEFTESALEVFVELLIKEWEGGVVVSFNS